MPRKLPTRETPALIERLRSLTALHPLMTCGEMGDIVGVAAATVLVWKKKHDIPHPTNSQTMTRRWRELWSPDGRLPYPGRGAENFT